MINTTCSAGKREETKGFPSVMAISRAFLVHKEERQRERAKKKKTRPKSRHSTFRRVSQGGRGKKLHMLCCHIFRYKFPFVTWKEIKVTKQKKKWALVEKGGVNEYTTFLIHHSSFVHNLIKEKKRKWFSEEIREVYSRKKIHDYAWCNNLNKMLTIYNIMTQQWLEKTLRK